MYCFDSIRFENEISFNFNISFEWNQNNYSKLKNVHIGGFEDNKEPLYQKSLVSLCI